MYMLGFLIYCVVVVLLLWLCCGYGIGGVEMSMNVVVYVLIGVMHGFLLISYLIFKIRYYDSFCVCWFITECLMN